MKKFKIEIPNPCHEDWNTMTPEAKGRFCGSCEQIVIDFTGMIPREIATTLSSQKNICGRVTAPQLEQTYFLPNKAYHFFPLRSIAAGFLLMLSPLAACTQVTTTSVELIEPKIMGEVSMVGKPLAIVKARVIDENRNPLANMTVNIINLERVIIATMTSDKDGFVELQIESDNTDELRLQILETKDFFPTEVTFKDAFFVDGNYLVECIGKSQPIPMIVGKMVAYPTKK